MDKQDYVVLVNEKNEPIGTSEKLVMHNSDTPLHKGFSVFLFNENSKLLLQQRSKKKKTWPLVWSNSVCGHPMLNETAINAAKRRLQFELGITNAQLSVMLPNYRYRFDKDGIVENEFCPVMVGFTDQEPTINPEEVEAVKWIAWSEWLNEIVNNPQRYSEWSVEETMLLNKNKQFHRFLQEATRKLASK